MRRIGGINGQRLSQTALRALIAAALMGAVAAGLLVLLRQTIGKDTLLKELILVVGSGGISGVLYLLLAQWFGVEEIRLFFAKIRQRLL